MSTKPKNYKPPRPRGHGRPGHGRRGATELTERQRFFLTYFRGRAKGNGTLAAILAGCPRKNAHVQAAKWLALPKVQAALRDLRDADPEVLTALEIQRLLSDMAASRGEWETSGLTDRDRLRALELLGKTHGIYLTKTMLEVSGNLDTGSMTDEQIREKLLAIAVDALAQEQAKAGHGK